MLKTNNFLNAMADVTPKCPACIVCGGDTVGRFSKQYCGGEACYFRCVVCGHLTASDLGEIPDYDRDTYFANVDTGWKDRNRRVLKFIDLLSRLPGIDLPAKSVVLDYGCGTGMLVSDLNAAGFNAYGFEPYQKSFENSARVLSDWHEARNAIGRAKLVTCIEVLEHVRNPDEFLRGVSELLATDGYFFVSTETYRERIHDSDWYYLNPSAGHVSIYTEGSLRFLMSQHGFSSILRMSGSVWLFRSVVRRKRTWLESAYFSASQSRIKLDIKLRP